MSLVEQTTWMTPASESIASCVVPTNDAAGDTQPSIQRDC